LLIEKKYKEALPAALDALKAARAIYDYDDPRLAESLNKVAAALYHLNRYKDSEGYYQLALKVEENAVRAGHENLSGLATVKSNLGALYLEQGRYAEAKPLLESAVAIGEEHAPPQSRAEHINNLAILYKNLGYYAKAESLYQQSNTIREILWGPDDSKVAISLDNLAGLYFEQGKFRESAALREKSLRILEKTLPPYDRDVATTRNNLAETYQRLGKYAEAEGLLRKTLAIQALVLGPGHTSVALLCDMTTSRICMRANTNTTKRNSCFKTPSGP
jgi:tetratricopeptide (TPR) repeat protein